MQHIGRRGTERGFAEDRHGDTQGADSGMPRGGGVRIEERSGNELIELGAWPGMSGIMSGAGDWRFGLMRELRALSAFLSACEAGTAPSPKQRASCMRRLDALVAALREQPRRDAKRYEVCGRVGAALAGDSESVTLRPREIEALRWRHKGLLPKEIAREMGITLLTARSYIRDAASKLDASGWEEAVRRAIELGIL